MNINHRLSDTAVDPNERLMKFQQAFKSSYSSRTFERTVEGKKIDYKLSASSDSITAASSSSGSTTAAKEIHSDWNFRIFNSQYS